MITTDKKSFEQAMLQRGYALAELAECILSEDGDQITIDETSPAYPRRPKKGLGDMVAAGLSAVGITEERVSKLVGGDCGCSKRKEFLNQLGRKLGIGQEG